MTSSTDARRAVSSAPRGTSNGTRASRRVRLARTIRCATVDSGTRNARAISSVVSPPSSRSVSATRASVESTGWQAMNMRRSRSWPMASLLVLVLRDTRLDELPHQRRGEGLVGGEANGALGRGVRRELLLERLRDIGAHEEAAVILERSVAHQHAVVLEHRDPVADDLGRLGRGGLDRLAQLLERGPRGGWDRPEVGGHRGKLFHEAKNSVSTGAMVPAATLWV